MWIVWRQAIKPDKTINALLSIPKSSFWYYLMLANMPHEPFCPKCWQAGAFMLSRCRLAFWPKLPATATSTAQSAPWLDPPCLAHCRAKLNHVLYIHKHIDMDTHFQWLPPTRIYVCVCAFIVAPSFQQQTKHPAQCTASVCMCVAFLFAHTAWLACQCFR